MPNDNSSQDHPEFEKISPTNIEITPSRPANSTEGQADTRNNTQFLLFGGLLALVVIALAVIFLLPRFIDEPVLAPAPQENEASRNVETGRSPAISPWEEAQKVKLRKQANEILAELLETQGSLEEKKVALWALDAFNHAKDLAQQGDQSYRQTSFEEAVSFYEQALKEMNDLFARVDQVVEQTFAEGEQALAENDAERAEQAFLLVLNIAPSHTEAETGLIRARSLNNVLALLAQADELENNGELIEALSLFEQTLQIDAQVDLAKEGVKRVKSKLAEQKFNAVMSDGFLALSQNKFSSAKKAFSQALKLKPKSREARDGLEQANLQIIQSRISRLRQQAEQFAKQEQWQRAVQRYDDVLRLDASLQFAQAGKKHSATRSRLDQLLVERINQPERLSSPSVFKETQILLGVAKKVSAPGQRLSQQIAQIESQLRLAVIPVVVSLKSDNFTEVTIKKVADLGKFIRHEISLKPGEYVIVGKRLGYRDVRTDVTISPDIAQGSGKQVIRAPILIQCTEKI